MVKHVQLRGHSRRDGKLPRATVESIVYREDDEAGWLNLQVREGFNTTDMQELNTCSRGRFVITGSYTSGKVNRHFCKFMWSMGRGYAPYLQEVLDIREESGLLRVQTRGTYITPNHPGIWTLLIDPAKNWLVRDASFDKLHLTNDGEIGEPGLPVAARAVWNDAAENSSAQEIFFYTVSHDIPEGLFEQAHREVLGPYPARTFVGEAANPGESASHEAEETRSE